MRLLPLLLSAPLLLCGCFGCLVEAERSLDFDPGDAASLRIAAGAGYLRVTGAPEATRVQVRGRACAPDEATLQGVRIEHHRDGDAWMLTAVFPAAAGGSLLDLDVSVPDGMAVAIEDGSGAVDVTGVASLRLVDGSGAIRIRGVRGDLRLRDGSGSVEIRGVGGEVWIHDGSGSVTITGAGSVTIDADGSGSLSIDRVAGDVHLGPQGSGSVDIANVGGRVLPRR